MFKLSPTHLNRITNAICIVK
ncbi:hypothetical protein BN2475_410013 [Paraburkholderia ribeironis]|uniref:Uncharacterized protein n=1 Tax=Paraburkholderia ribeironis TaxID=1247936 RepID=A0A1N7S834_9BURK|nr:hypothetical protein BN2475_410013 [Paraburkholderia ribeironis]